MNAQVLQGVKKIIRAALARRGLTLSRRPAFLQRHPEYRFDQLIQCIALEVLGHCEETFFVQIGANDGATNDPFYEMARRHHWSGLVVEPCQDAFAALERSYIHMPEVRCVNVAIDVAPGSRELFRITPDAPAQLRHSGVSSFDKNHVLKWVPRGRDDLLVTDVVRCESFNSLVGKYMVERVDLLIVDTEGHDFEILKTIDLRHFHIPLILFEYCCLAPRDQDACLEYLGDCGYTFHVVDDYDIICVRPRVAT